MFCLLRKLHKPSILSVSRQHSKTPPVFRPAALA
jgi:hypothetical protein